MKTKIPIILFLIFITYPIFSQVKYDLSFPFDGYNREYIVSVPTKPAPAEGWPLVMMMHGTSGDKDVFYDAKGWKELGQKENFVTVFPSSLKWCFTEFGIKKVTTRFVNGNLLDSLCPVEFPRLISDIAFMREMIKRISESIKINPQKVFSSGFSNGCVMMFKTAMDAGDIFKACAGNSGIYHELDSITPAHRVPILYAVGTKDDRFVTPNFPTIPYGGDSLILFFDKMIVRTLASQGLAKKFTKSETAITKSYTYSECLPGIQCAPFVFIGVKNMAHVYPNGINFPIDGPLAYWNFFNNPPQTTQSSVTHDTDSHLFSIYPNPGQNTISITTPWQEGRVSFYNMLGTLVNNSPLKNEIDVSHLSPGIYIIKCVNDNGSEMRTLRWIKN